MNLEGVTIRMPDLRRAGICGKGARAFWAERGWDWPGFLEFGIAAQTLWDTEDGYARMVVRRKMAREGTDG